MKFDDSLISHIAKILQVALITGTDIVDNLRTIRLEEKEGNIHMSPKYEEEFNKNIENLLSELQNRVNE